MKILIVETLYLGDLIHTLPLLRAVRARFADAELHLLARSATAPLLHGDTGIDRLWVMDPRQHRHWAGLRRLAATLKAEHYDLAINPGGSDRAALLTWMSGARRRVGRLNRKGSRRLWALFHDEVVRYPYDAEPMWWQKWQAFRQPLQLADAGDHGRAFGMDGIGLGAAPAGLPARYIHISPCASEDARSLPASTVVELLHRLHAALPEQALVVTGGPSERERSRLALIAGAVAGIPVRFHAGDLSLPALADVIRRASLHIGPDSGPLHLAAALGRPVLGCFLYKNGSAEWLPVGARARTVGVRQKLAGGLYGLDVEALVTTARVLL